MSGGADSIHRLDAPTFFVPARTPVNAGGVYRISQTSCVQPNPAHASEDRIA